MGLGMMVTGAGHNQSPCGTTCVRVTPISDVIKLLGAVMPAYLSRTTTESDQSPVTPPVLALIKRRVRAGRGRNSCVPNKVSSSS
jgi:hypothetical protein